MSEIQPEIKIGDRVRIMSTKFMEEHGLGGSIGEVVPLIEPCQNAVAIHLLTGPRAYETIVVGRSHVSPHRRACYWCSNKSPMNNRDMVRCVKHDRVNASSGTCQDWTA